MKYLLFILLFASCTKKMQVENIPKVETVLSDQDLEWEKLYGQYMYWDSGDGSAIGVSSNSWLRFLSNDTAGFGKQGTLPSGLTGNGIEGGGISTTAFIGGYNRKKPDSLVSIKITCDSIIPGQRIIKTEDKAGYINNSRKNKSQPNIKKYPSLGGKYINIGRGRNDIFWHGIDCGGDIGLFGCLPMNSNYFQWQDYYKDRKWIEKVY